MSRIQEQDVMLVSAFTTGDGAGGNPAGVVLDADHLSDGARQAIAAATGLSETAFVSRSATASIKLDFFTPRRRIAHCGHATIATFGLLGATGRLASGSHSKETIDGLRAVEVSGSYASMEQRPPAFRTIDQTATLTALGLDPSDVDTRFSPEIVDTGNGFVLVGVDSPDVLGALAPNMEALETLSEAEDLVGAYVFTTLTGDPDVAATTRMFAPRYGISEESATGMAAGPLAGLLHRRHAAGAQMTIEQGRFMHAPSRSLLYAEVKGEGAAVASLAVGGYAKTSRTLRIAYPDPG